MKEYKVKTGLTKGEVILASKFRVTGKQLYSQVCDKVFSLGQLLLLLYMFLENSPKEARALIG